MTDFIPLWLSHYRTTDIADITYEVAELKVKHIVEYFPDNLKLKNITPIMANDFYLYLRKKGKRKVKKILIDYGEPQLSLHKLRYSTASILYEKGYSIKEIQYYLGHCDATTTMNIYTHIERQRLKAGMIEL